MFALGLVLLVVSGVFTLGVVLSNTDPVSASAFGVSLTNVSLGGLFLAGAVAGLVIMLGLAMMVAGAARKRHRRVQTKRTVKGVRAGAFLHSRRGAESGAVQLYVTPTEYWLFTSVPAERQLRAAAIAAHGSDVWAAAQAFLAYRRRGGARSSPLPDFYIGAHAQVENLRGRLKSHFSHG